jgi:hypothetical protein
MNANRNPIKRFLPPDPDGDFLEWLGTYKLATAIVVGAVSYSRNQSAPWALFHAWIGTPYLAYVGFKSLTSEATVEPEVELVEVDPLYVYAVPNES